DRRLEALALRLANAEKSLERQVEIRVRNARERLGHLSRTLHVVSPLQTLGRGYAVLTSEDGTVVSSTTQVKAGDDVSAQVSDGSIGLTVKDRRKT
ncbi:MAG: exodeoxyribonuclease VII large subunit, partial [Xanthomonadales bacterium]|nr:exodeoxyribonuclease VII large subunit [Xanthomonadales bacterium]